MINKRTFSIVVDLRCLQDPGFATRGIGRHALSLLRQVPKDQIRLIGLVDETLPPLLPEARAVVHEVRSNAYAAGHDSSAFVTLSPMTHDPIFVGRLLSNPALLRAAVVYDFIPHRWPDRYLPKPADRLAYAVALRWLARCDLFLPISRSTADDLVTLLSIRQSSIAITGCAIDPGFDASTDEKPLRHILVVGGGDTRKNPEVVIRAHAQTPSLQGGAGIPLVIGGNYGAADAASLRNIARAAGGRPDLVEVPGHVSDAELIDLYHRAFVLVAPSRDEGFSIPVIEGMAVGVPCLTSAIPAHAELVADTGCQFEPDDDAALGPMLARAVSDPVWRAATLAQQAKVWPNFHIDAVGARFWDAILARLDARPAQYPRPFVLRGHKPRVAILSPMPPEHTGVADYTAATCDELGKLVDLHVFTETPQPAPLRNVASIRPLDVLPHVSAGFDRVISVVGNSHLHLRILELLRRYGGACIAHDARMLGFYRILLGQDKALDVASRELGRVVTEAELNLWLSDEGKLEALFLGEIAESAAPLIVHSSMTARLVRERYGVDAVHLPFTTQRPWTAADLAPARRAAVRQRIGIATSEVLVVTFGFVHGTKAPEECLWALELLRGWGIPAQLHFVGDLAAYQEAPRLRALAAALGLTDYVHFFEGYVSEQTFRNYLLAADVGVQLRTYGFGSMSGALMDSATAGLPTVTNKSLFEAMDLPAEYVRAVPDEIGALLVAEALADLLGARLGTVRSEAARQAFCKRRSIANYVADLTRALHLEVGAALPAIAAA